MNCEHSAVNEVERFAAYVARRIYKQRTHDGDEWNTIVASIVANISPCSQSQSRCCRA